jgi:hypothetical protein
MPSRLRRLLSASSVRFLFLFKKVLNIIFCGGTRTFD